MENTLYRILVKQNPWWIKEKIDNPKAFLPQREIFPKLTFLLEKPRILAIIGPRRTGKTVCLFQLIRFLLEKKKVKPESIGYLLCDDPEIELYLLSHSLGEIIDGFLEERGEEMTYLFLDEVQYLANWAKWLKKYHEFYPNLKIVITGSSSLHLSAGSRESLVGRLVEEILLPMGFFEYVKIKKQLNKGEKPVETISSDPVRKTDFLLTHPKEQLVREKSLVSDFRQFLLYGGFPEGLFEKDINLWQEYLKEDIVKRQIYHDIVKIFRIENPSLLENLLFFIGSHQSELFSFESFLKALPFGSKETVVNYLAYLNESFLIKSLGKFSRKALIKQKKYFLTDPGLANMITGRTTLLADEEFLGHLVEGLVANSLIRKHPCFFFRDEKGREIDLIIRKDKEIIPIEVKYRENIKMEDLSSLVYFIKRQNVSQGLVLTKKLLKKEKIDRFFLYFLPVWEFLY
ncbi:ATP-binding protein [Candidatus Gottesmanbacteria bacterium]|nr:ATP-binding protein [Candidatus Gottesmanbacteria bacterium]